MERLNKAQIIALRAGKKRSPKFFDNVSLVTITKDYRNNKEKQNFVSEMSKHDAYCEMRMPNA